MKNNIDRMQVDKVDYLSDKELQSLIQNMEQEDMIHAPHYLKESILEKIKSEERVTSISSHRSSKVQLITYAMKVGVAAAAAIVLLLLIPVGDLGGLPDEEIRYEEWLNNQKDIDEKQKYQEKYEENWKKDSYEYYKENKSIYDTTNEICSKLLEKTNKLFGKEDK